MNTAPRGLPQGSLAWLIDFIISKLTAVGIVVIEPGVFTTLRILYFILYCFRLITSHVCIHII